jgi:hypothetical protein
VSGGWAGGAKPQGRGGQDGDWGRGVWRLCRLRWIGFLSPIDANPDSDKAAAHDLAMVRVSFVEVEPLKSALPP